MRCTIGGPDCKQPYSASLLNISAMSYGALSQNAILSLNGGAKLGNFYHNTGEGGISRFHKEPGCATVIPRPSAGVLATRAAAAAAVSLIRPMACALALSGATSCGMSGPVILVAAMVTANFASTCSETPLHYHS